MSFIDTFNYSRQHLKISINNSLGFNLLSTFTPEIINRAAFCRLMGFDQNKFFRMEKRVGFERSVKHFRDLALKAKEVK
ncbi:hypothetical protein DFO62_10725 [Serratia fonticola]|nr:hypothetical protein DFO62_10725 [Serratia fonticola]